MSLVETDWLQKNLENVKNHRLFMAYAPNKEMVLVNITINIYQMQFF